MKNVGLAFWRMALLDSSLYYYEEAQKIAIGLDDQLLLSKILNNIALVYQDRNQYSLSIDYFLRAFDIQKENDDKATLSVTMTNIGMIYFQIQNYQEARNYIDQALTLARAENYMYTECYACAASIELFTVVGDHDQSEMMYRDAIRSCREIGNRYFESLAIFNHAQMELDQGNFISALKEFQDALAIQIEVGDNKKQNTTYNRIGISLMKANELAQASSNFRKARDMALNNGFIDDLSMSYFYLSKIDSIDGNFRNAYNNFQYHKSLSDSIQRLKQFNELSEIRIRYETRQKENENVLLRQERELQSAIIDRQNLNKKFYSLAILMAVIVIISLGMLFLQVKKSNKKLIHLNAEIRNREEKLEIANEEKESKNKELQQTLNELQTTQKQLIDAEKLASFGVLSAGISHEINNPLNFIKLGVENLQKKLPKLDPSNENNHTKEVFNIINEGIDRASSIVKSLTQLSAEDRRNYKEIDIHTIVGKAVTTVSSQRKSGVKLVKNFDTQHLVIYGDETKLTQAMVNVLLNAEHAIPNKGIIDITTKLQGDKVLVGIQDTGQGIDRADMDRIADPFFTTKEPGEGIGLGLSIVYRIVQEHGGEIDITSKKGEGTTVNISLPLVIKT